jgi:hypothetical protein
VLDRKNLVASRSAGYALMAVVVFALVGSLIGFSLYAIATYENKGAHYRQNSSEAFYLADGGIERARAEFLNSRTWREGWTDVPSGRGKYDVAVSDTTFEGKDAIRLLSQGRVKNATRRVEAIVEIPPTAWDLVLLVMGDTDVNGNLCLNGQIHVNGDVDFGAQESHLQCGEYTNFCCIFPPSIYTDPDHFPDATFYYVQGRTLGTGAYGAHIFDRDRNDITHAVVGDSLDGPGIVGWDNPTKTWSFEFKAGDVNKYFNETTGVFRPRGGATTAVVNFGESDLLGGNPNYVSAVYFQAADTVHATIINTRFTGITEEDRLDPGNWMGGLTKVQHIVFAPRQGIGIICYDFEKTGAALVQFGTEEWPALLYVTHNVTTLNANFNLVGSLIVLGDFGDPHIAGGPDFQYDDGFIDNLPGYLRDGWNDGVSGTMKILRWREVAAAGS